MTTAITKLIFPVGLKESNQVSVWVPFFKLATVLVYLFPSLTQMASKTRSLILQPTGPSRASWRLHHAVSRQCCQETRDAEGYLEAGRDVSLKEKIPIAATFKIMTTAHTQLSVDSSVVCWGEGWTSWRETSREAVCSLASALPLVSLVTLGLSFLMRKREILTG